MTEDEVIVDDDLSWTLPDSEPKRMRISRKRRMIAEEQRWLDTYERIARSLVRDPERCRLYEKWAQECRDAIKRLERNEFNAEVEAAASETAKVVQNLLDARAAAKAAARKRLDNA